VGKSEAVSEAEEKQDRPGRRRENRTAEAAA